MKKNFIQKHAIFIGVIAFCFMFVPFIKEKVYGFEQKSSEANISIITPSEKKAAPAPVKKRVVIDAGHGGYDAGSQSDSGIKEKDITLDITKKIGKLLQDKGVSVVYTRTSDTVQWPSDNVEDLLKRSEIANASGADYFVSIHTNFSDVSKNNVKGSEVWVRHDNGVNDRFANVVNDELKKVTGIQNRGLKDEETSPLSLLRYNNMPSILIETGFLSNDNDTRILSSKNGQNAIANAIAKGILQILDEKNDD